MSSRKSPYIVSAISTPILSFDIVAEIELGAEHAPNANTHDIATTIAININILFLFIISSVGKIILFVFYVF